MKGSKKRSIIVSLITVLVLIICGAVLINFLFKTEPTYSPSTKKPIYYVKTNEKKIAITIDTTWGEDNVERMLEVFKKHDVKATFFVIGKWIDNYSEDAYKIYKDGHELANHSNYHKDFTKISRDEIIKEISGCDSKIKAITGETPKLLRVPSGAYNDTAIEAAESTDHMVIQWDVDSIDWKNEGAETEYNRVESKVSNGSILLFHTGTKYTVENLDKLIGKLKNEGYEIVPVSELLYKKNYKICEDGGQMLKE